MTLNDLIAQAGQHPLLLAAACVAPPVLALATGKLHAPGAGAAAPWRYVYAVLVYLACVPGMFACVLTGYALFFTHSNLLNVNLLVYFLPIASMVATLVFIRQRVSFDAVPGFDRLSGLMAMVGCSFVLALAIQKTNIFVFFGGSIERLFALALGVFALLKWGSHMLFRRRDDPKPERPKFPDAG